MASVALEETTNKSSWGSSKFSVAAVCKMAGLAEGPCQRTMACVQTGAVWETGGGRDTDSVLQTLNTLNRRRFCKSRPNTEHYRVHFKYF